MSGTSCSSPLAFLLFLISATAELGRAPFDLTEAESELVAGHHIEYSGMKFGLFYASELLHTFTFGGFIAAFFFGGWRGPWVEQVPMLGLLYFLIKAFIGYWLFGWIKYTLLRIRIDKMLDLELEVPRPVLVCPVDVCGIYECAPADSAIPVSMHWHVPVQYFAWLGDAGNPAPTRPQ